MTALDRRDLPLRPPPPVEAFTRVGVLDVLRGASLVGALVVNLAVFSADGGSPGSGNRIEWWAATIREVLTDGKWYPVFAFLFGYSMALQLRGQVPLVVRRRRVARRLAILGVLGVAHGLLLYRWDILFAYAVLGSLVYLARRQSSRTLTIASGALLAFGGWLATEPSIDAGSFGFQHTAGVPAIRIYEHGSLLNVMSLHAHNYLYNLTDEVLAQWPFVIAMMLLGLLAERHLLLTIATTIERRARFAALSIGATALVWNFVSEDNGFDRQSRITAFVGTLMTVGQAIGVIALMTLSDRPRRWKHELATLGRLSLTNYLMQSLICTTLLFGYGFGLGPHFTPLIQWLAVVGIVGVQLAFSHWWLRHHSKGPVEAFVSWWTHRDGHDPTTVRPGGVRRAH